jgi:DNA-binding NarL/FixJ family response regulator
MRDAGSAILWSSAPFATTIQSRREPAWSYYSQVSVANLAGHITEQRTEVRTGAAALTKPVERTTGGPTATVQRGATHEAHREDGPWSLTQRELDVLQLLAEGATNSEISERLFISPKTTKNHLAAIFQKLDVTNRTHALVRAVVMGLVTIE